MNDSPLATKCMNAEHHKTNIITMKAIIYTPEEEATIKEIRKVARKRYLREYRKKKKTNLI